MKKIFILGLLVLGSFSLFSAETLTFKIDNPRFIRQFVGPPIFDVRNTLQFDVLIKATATGTYFYSAQVFFYVNLGTFNTTVIPSFTPGPSFSGSFNYGSGLQPKYTTTNSWASGNLDASIYAPVYATGWPGASGAFTPITTSYQILGTVSIVVDDANLGALSGIEFKHDAMDGYAKYETTTVPYVSAYYASPNFYDGQDLKYVYTGRIYSSGSGWSQIGGTQDVITNHWTTPLNTTVWDTSSAAATIDTALALAGRFRIYAGARAKINAGKALTCSDSTIINSVNGLWIVTGTGTGGTGTADGSFLDNGTIVYNSGGTAKAERFLSQGSNSSPFIWHSYCIPVTSTTTAPFVQLYMKWYDEPNHKYWYIINPPLDSVLPATMKGYFMWSNPSTTGNKTVRVSGTLNTGLKSIPLTRTNNDPGPSNFDGYNFVGNPYPSAVNWVSLGGWALTGVDQTGWFWVDASNDWGVFNRTSVDSTLGVSRFIPPNQGFFVHVTSPLTSGLLAVNNTARLHKPVAYYKDGSNGYADRLSLGITGTGGKDEVIVRFDPSSSLAYNADFDAYKHYGAAEAPQLYCILPDANATIDVLPWTSINQVVPIGFSCGVPGTFTLTAGNISSFRPGIEIYLEDKQIPGNAWPDLRTNPVYQFSYATGDDPNRFILHFTNVYFGINDHTINAMQIYSYEDFVYVKNLGGGNTQGDVFIYDLTGRKIFQDKLQNSLINKYNIHVNEGYYLVNVITPDNSYHQKVYLK